MVSGRKKNDVVGALAELAEEARASSMQARLLEIEEHIRSARLAGASLTKIAERLSGSGLKVSYTSLQRFVKERGLDTSSSRPAMRPKAKPASANLFGFSVKPNSDDEDL